MKPYSCWRWSWSCIFCQLSNLNESNSLNRQKVDKNSNLITPFSVRILYKLIWLPSNIGLFVSCKMITNFCSFDSNINMGWNIFRKTLSLNWSIWRPLFKFGTLHQKMFLKHQFDTNSDEKNKITNIKVSWEFIDGFTLLYVECWSIISSWSSY